jgi:hypothetical protein
MQKFRSSSAYEIYSSREEAFLKINFNLHFLLFLQKSQFLR